MKVSQGGLLSAKCECVVEGKKSRYVLGDGINRGPTTKARARPLHLPFTVHR